LSKLPSSDEWHFCSAFQAEGVTPFLLMMRFQKMNLQLSAKDHFSHAKFLQLTKQDPSSLPGPFLAVTVQHEQAVMH